MNIKMPDFGKLGKQLGRILDEFTGAAEQRRQLEYEPYEIPYSVFSNPILNQPTHANAQVLTLQKVNQDEVAEIWQRLAMNVNEHVGNKKYPATDDTETEASKTMSALSELGDAIQISALHKSPVILPTKSLERLVNSIGFLHETRDEMADIAGIASIYRSTDQDASMQDGTVINLAAFQRKAEHKDVHQRVKEMAGETVMALDLLLPAIEENLPPLLYARKPHLDPDNGPFSPEDFRAQGS